MESACSDGMDIGDDQESKVRRSINMKIDVDSAVTDEHGLFQPNQAPGNDETPMDVHTDALEEEETYLDGSYDEDSSDSELSMEEEEEYHSDVSLDEDEDEELPEPGMTPRMALKGDMEDVPGKQDYLDTCKQLNVVPVWSFVRMMRVHRLRIRHRSLGPLGTRAICVPVAMSPYITALDLEDNGMGAEGAWSVTEMLKANQQITTVNLSYNNLGPEGALAVAEMLEENKVITSIDLSGNHFGESDGVHFARVLKENTTLQELILKENEFRENGARLIGKGLVLNSTLRRLDLSWNHIRNKGALAICTAMKKNLGLRDLDVSWNGFSDAGAIAMAATLKVNVTLTDLDLTNNRIGPTGVRAIANALLVNQTLTTLRMGKNNVPYEEGAILLKAIKKNKNSAMSQLDLTDVAVNQDFLRFLRKINKLKGRNMTAIYGFVQRKVMKQEWQQPLEDPRRIFQDYILRNHLRISDVFRRFDKKQNMVITVEEFRTGMKESNIIMEPWQLERLIQKLDSDGDGLIDYSDLLEGQRKLVHKERRQLKRKLTKKKIKVEEKKQVLEQMDVALRAKPPKEPVPPWKAVSKLALLAARSNSRDSRRSSVLQTPKLPALNEGQVVTTAVNRWVALTAQRAGASSQASPRTTSQLSLRTTSQLAPHLQPILKVPDDPETTEQPTLPEQPTRKVSGIIAVDRMPPVKRLSSGRRLSVGGRATRVTTPLTMMSILSRETANSPVPKLTEENKTDK
ncbi:leucine-rich repeat-containing protein 74A-like [Branchiostoma floridae]|uniref:Leucine-rich repeat-containing protein 74A-like n=1 Tax=Branchiostoma floridae TaxID=7739 RepID=A0A9J7LE46_BRAFL|nr:leucine-rich repeat-containing protein 74A-like [Branchiostoma floridae]